MCTRAKWLVLTLFVLVVVTLQLTLSVPMSAQVAGATLSGTVTDATGSAIPGADISVKDVDTGILRVVKSDSAGFYSVPNLTPGGYEVTSTAPGFETLVHSGLTLTVGVQQQLNLAMQVGQVTQKVEVTAEAPAVELASSEISATVEENAVQELPLNGRSWSDLAQLQRGVINVETAEVGGACTRGCGNVVAINGARVTQNNYRLDGVSIMDQYNSGPGSVIGGNLGVDAIQEFSVLTQNYSAEYGKTSGGVINAVTRSGTNQIHGSAYEFLRNSALDARNYFDPSTIPPFRRNQFGGSLGGPIQKDKTFVFGDYEGIRQSLTNTSTIFVPSAAAHSGTLSTGNVTVDPTIQHALLLFPIPNNGQISQDIGKWTFGRNTVSTENYFTIRGDRTFSQKDKFGVTYVFDHSLQLAPDNYDLQEISNAAQRHFAILEWTHVFNSNVGQTVRFAYTRNAVFAAYSAGVINPEAADASLAAFPGGKGMPSVSISGGISGNPGGVGSNIAQYSIWNTFQGYEDAFAIKGNHALKFGFAIERDQENYINNTQPGGAYSFGSLANFLINKPSRLQAALPGTLTPRHFRQTILGAYIQDDFHFRPNLTLNLGLRWEMSTVLNDVNGKTATLHNPFTDTQTFTGVAGYPYYQNPTLRDFQPRVGFAWDPFKNGKSSVRGGFGIFDVLPLAYDFTSFGGQSEPFFEVGSASNLPIGSFPSGGIGLLAGNPTTFRAVWVQQNPKRNYVMQWNLDLQRQITESVSASVGYVGSRGVHQPFRTDEYDMVVPTPTSAGYLFPAPIGSGTRLNTNFGDIRALFWGGWSDYNGLVAQVVKRLSHGLQLQGAFTWGRSLDTSSSTQEGDSYLNSIASLHWFNLRTMDYGPSDFQINRTFVVNGTWLVPGRPYDNDLVNALANGWQLGTIFKINDGAPFTLTWGTGADPSGTLASDDTAYPDRLTGSGCGTPVNPGNPTNYIKTQCFSIPTAPTMAYWQANCDTTSKVFGPTKTTEPFPYCFNLRGNEGRNSAYGPGLADVDFSLFKNNYIKKISETFNAQFRAEIFNILNHTNFRPPSTPVDVFTSNGTTNPAVGQLTSTATTSREVQFSLKLIW